MRPSVKIKKGSNVFDIISACSKVLKQDGQFAQAEALKRRIFLDSSRDPKDVLEICKEYVDLL